MSTVAQVVEIRREPRDVRGMAIVGTVNGRAESDFACARRNPGEGNPGIDVHERVVKDREEVIAELLDCYSCFEKVRERVWFIRCDELNAPPNSVFCFGYPRMHCHLLRPSLGSNFDGAIVADLRNHTEESPVRPGRRQNRTLQDYGHGVYIECIVH